MDRLLNIPVEHEEPYSYKDSHSNVGITIGVPLGAAVFFVIGASVLYHWYKNNSSGVVEGPSMSPPLPAENSVNPELGISQQQRDSFIESFPVCVFCPSGERMDKMGDQCPICLEEYAQGDNLRLLPLCPHSFHIGCLARAWRDVLQPPRCPCCRREYATWRQWDIPPI